MKTLALSTLLLASVNTTLAADHVVKMLNNGKDGPMVFEPAFVKAAAGDTVVFTPAEKGAHMSNSLLIPAGAKPWRATGADQEQRVRVEQEGVYLYVCEPHKPMGMVGVIQVGKPVNLAEAKVVAAKEQAGFVLGKTRFDAALAQVR